MHSRLPAPLPGPRTCWTRGGSAAPQPGPRYGSGRLPPGASSSPKPAPPSRRPQVTQHRVQPQGPTTRRAVTGPRLWLHPGCGWETSELGPGVHPLGGSRPAPGQAPGSEHAQHPAERPPVPAWRHLWACGRAETRRAQPGRVRAKARRPPGSPPTGLPRSGLHPQPDLENRDSDNPQDLTHSGCPVPRRPAQGLLTSRGL